MKNYPKTTGTLSAWGHLVLVSYQVMSRVIVSGGTEISAQPILRIAVRRTEAALLDGRNPPDSGRSAFISPLLRCTSPTKFVPAVGIGLPSHVIREDGP